jgi:hypothetical protein
MAEVNIVKSFMLSLEDGSQRLIHAGKNFFENEVAEHWYVKAHSDNPPDPVVTAGTPEFAQQQAAYNARQRILNAATEQSRMDAANAVGKEARDQHLAAAQEEQSKYDESERVRLQQARGQRPTFAPPGTTVASTDPEVGTGLPNAGGAVEDQPPRAVDPTPRAVDPTPQVTENPQLAGGNMDGNGGPGKRPVAQAAVNPSARRS